MTELLAPILTSPAFKLAEQLIALFAIVLYAATIFWTFRDANRRGAMGWFWALVIAVSIVFFPIALVFYIVVRPPETLEDTRERELEILARETELRRDHQTCSRCQSFVQEDYIVCPKCMATLRKPCTSCGHALELEWNVCPYCATKQ
ncbi:MAG: zinc ribbon domain-containing protein [Coriobacteriia bacterium]|nr:zinc ribbon domain-containing protein [Coriobacteriia bacterium]